MQLASVIAKPTYISGWTKFTPVAMVSIWCQMPLALATTPSSTNTPRISRSARCGRSTGLPSAMVMRMPHRRLPGVCPGQMTSGIAT